MGISLLINGISGSGKSCSLHGLLNHPDYKVFVLNCDNGKPLPFKTDNTNFTQKALTSWGALSKYLELFIQHPEYNVLVIDTITLALKLYEEKYVKAVTQSDPKKYQSVWSDYQSYLLGIMDLINQAVNVANKHVIVTAHLATVDVQGQRIVQAAIAGGLKNLSLEALFTYVVEATVKTTSELEEYKNSLLSLPDDLSSSKIKKLHVFQTQHTETTTDHRIKCGMNNFSVEETFIDNNVLHLLNRLT